MGDVWKAVDTCHEVTVCSERVENNEQIISQMAVYLTNQSLLESCHFYKIVWISGDFNQGKRDESIQDVDSTGFLYHVRDRNVAEHRSGSQSCELGDD